MEYIPLLCEEGNVVRRAKHVELRPQLIRVLGPAGHTAGDCAGVRHLLRLHSLPYALSVFCGLVPVGGRELRRGRSTQGRACERDRGSLLPVQALLHHLPLCTSARVGHRFPQNNNARPPRRCQAAGDPLRRQDIRRHRSGGQARQLGGAARQLGESEFFSARVNGKVFGRPPESNASEVSWRDFSKVDS